jgi:hypothetical protein
MAYLPIVRLVISSVKALAGAQNGPWSAVMSTRTRAVAIRLS